MAMHVLAFAKMLPWQGTLLEAAAFDIFSPARSIRLRSASFDVWTWLMSAAGMARHRIFRWSVKVAGSSQSASAFPDSADYVAIAMTSRRCRRQVKSGTYCMMNFFSHLLQRYSLYSSCTSFYKTGPVILRNLHMCTVV